MVEMKTLKSREEWLEARKKSVGGSEAAACVGLHPHLTNTELFMLKTGRATAKDLTDNALVKYGQAAEEHIRELFRLDFPDWAIYYEANAIWRNSDFPGCHASVDGLIRDERGRLGILEIKTATIQSRLQSDKWRDGVPQNYYCQVLFYMAILNADFAVLVSQQKRGEGTELVKITRHYMIEKAEAEGDMVYLMDGVRDFVKHVESDTCPPLILPDF